MISEIWCLKSPGLTGHPLRHGIPEYNTKKLEECVQKQDEGRFLAKLQCKTFNKAKNNFYLMK